MVTKTRSNPASKTSEQEGGRRILIADDDPIVRKALADCLTSGSHDVLSLASGTEVIREIDGSFDLAIVDLCMPGASGIECLEYCQTEFPGLPVMVISGNGGIEHAVQAMKGGAVDYICKPFNRDELLLCVDRAIRNSRIVRENREMRQVINESGPTVGWIGCSEASRLLNEQIGRVACLDSTVMLKGESGTGKSMVARLIHQQSHRASNPFVAVNCAALPRDLIESELFGHEKGAFTGAVSERIGRAEVADGGTLFLDEIGDLPLELQPKLLTFLQDRVVQRIGCNRLREVDVRIIAATHQDLETMCCEGRFRQDLYYRLNVLAISIAPLRERLADLPELCSRILNRIARHRNGPETRISDDAIAALATHTWQGNIRELENVLERSSAFCEGGLIGRQDVARNLDTDGRSDAAVSNIHSPSASMNGRTLREIERQAIVDTIRGCQGNKALAARTLGISEKSIYNKIKRLQIDKNLLEG